MKEQLLLCNGFGDVIMCVCDYSGGEHSNRPLADTTGQYNTEHVRTKSVMNVIMTFAKPQTCY